MRPIADEVPVEVSLGVRLLLPESPPPPRGHPLVAALHGYGEDAVTMAARLAQAGDVPWAWLCPDAPFPFVLERDGVRRVGRSWYSYTGDSRALVSEMSRSAALLERLLEETARRHPLDLGRAALLGYSQGGYLASHLALAKPEQFGALVAVACRVKVEAFDEEGLRRARDLRVLAVHGRRDRRVPWPPQERSLEALRSAGLRVETQLHAGGHAFPDAAWPAIVSFLRDALPAA